MTAGDIQRLEREAEQSRRRLVENLARLRADDQPAQVRRRLSAKAAHGKDELVGRARNAAQRRADGLVEGLKARIAANPGAALAIGGGLAWRLYRHPPIATILVGAGLVSLLRTSPEARPASERIAAGVAEFKDTLREKAHDLRDVDAASETKRLAQAAGERLDAFLEATAERIGEWSGQAGDAARRRFRETSKVAGDLGRKGRELAVAHAPTNPRDQYLLGGAALALIAAVGIAGLRRARSGNDADAPPLIEATAAERQPEGSASRRPRAAKRSNGRRGQRD
jgi:hypothetical protein